MYILESLFYSPLLPIVGIVGIILLVVFIISRYKVATPTKALVVSGMFLGKKREGTNLKIFRNSGTFVFPIIQQHAYLDMSVMNLSVRTPQVITQQGVPLAVSGTVVVKVGSTFEDIATASEQFLDKKREEREEITQEVLEGHLRAILGKMTVESIYSDREGFSNKVLEIASPDLNNMGLTIVSFTLKDISDEQGYLEALGRPQIAEVKKNAEVAESEAEKESRIQRANSEQVAKQSEIQRATEIAESEKIRRVKVSKFDEEEKIVTAQTKKTIMEENMLLELAEKTRLIDLEKAETELNSAKLKASLETKADADLYVAKKTAEAEKNRRVTEAEAKAEEVRLEAESIASQIRLKGEAEADRIFKIGEAEAKSITSKAEAMSKMDEVGQFELLLNKLPDIIREINRPLGNIDKIVSYGGDNPMEKATMSGLKSSMDILGEFGIDLPSIVNGKAINSEIVNAITTKETKVAENVPVDDVE